MEKRFKYDSKTKTASGMYAVYDLSGYNHQIDNDMDMLECPGCERRVTMQWFLLAIGTAGTRFCPYCGRRLIKNDK